MQEIVHGLYLGPYSTAKCLSALVLAQITHVVCIRSLDEEKFIRPCFPNELSYHVMYDFFQLNFPKGASFYSNPFLLSIVAFSFNYLVRLKTNPLKISSLTFIFVRLGFTKPFKRVGEFLYTGQCFVSFSSSSNFLSL